MPNPRRRERRRRREMAMMAKGTMREKLNTRLEMIKAVKRHEGKRVKRWERLRAARTTKAVVTMARAKEMGKSLKGEGMESVERLKM
jgi:hypothetical protein